MLFCDYTFPKMMKIFSKFMIMISLSFSVTSSFTITSGPENTIVCMNVMVPCACGFTGGNPEHLIPDWRIVYRSGSSNVISNDTINGDDISLQRINGLQWLPDINNGNNNAPNSQLLVGPVNMTLNQSSYQCMFRILGPVSIMSSVGTITVVDLPSVIINVDEICTTSINISLNTQNHPACGEVSHIVTISDNVVYPDGDSSKYFIDGLQSDTLHNIIVTSAYNNNSGSRIFYQSVRTSLPKLPNPIDTTSIIIKKTSRSSVRIMWKLPKFDRCSMLAINYYDVIINSGGIEIKAEIEQNDYLATFPHEHFSDHLSTTFTVNVTVVDISGQRSTTSSVTVAINGTKLQNTSSSPTAKNNTEPESDVEATDNNDSKPILITISIVVALLIILCIFVIISILYLRCRKNNAKNLRIATEENCYTTQDECKNQDLASPYAVSGPSSPGPNSTQSNITEVSYVYEPSVHTDHTNGSVHNENIDKDESTPPLPRKLNYAELLLDNAAPKFINADNHVTYVETKPT